MEQPLSECAFKAGIFEIFNDEKMFPKSFPPDLDTMNEKVAAF